MKTSRRAVFAVLAASLCACDLTLPWAESGTPPDDGGGGGGGGGAPAKDGSFTLDRNSLSFHGFRSGSAPAAQSVLVDVAGADVVSVHVFSRLGVVPWLSANLRGSGRAWVLDVGILDTAMPPSLYTATLTIATFDATGAQLAERDVGVMFRIEERITIPTNTWRATTTLGDPFSVVVTAVVFGAGKTWSPTTDVPWLTVTPGTRTGNGSVDVTVNSADLLTGTHVGHVRATNTADPLDSGSMDVVVTVVEPTLEFVGISALVVGGQDGLGPREATARIRLMTGTSHPYTLAALADDGGSWLSVSPASGTLSFDGATITVMGSGAAAPGTYSGRLRLSATVAGRVLTRELPVTFNRGELRVWPESRGVGLSSAPSQAVLTRTLAVHASGPDSVAWTAQTDQAWLSVTPSGQTGQPLTLTAHPTGLAEGTHLATVTITAPPAPASQVRVGLRVGPDAPETVPVAIAGFSAVSSPVEPLVFLSDGIHTVTARDVYTGEVVRTFDLGVTLTGEMAVSGDGRNLYVHVPYATPAPEVLEVDATTGAIGRRFPTPAYEAASTSAGVDVIQPSGHPMLVTPSSRVFDLETGREFTDPTFVSLTYAGPVNGGSGDGTLLTTAAGVLFRTGYTVLSGGRLTIAYDFGFPEVAGRLGQTCLRRDGKVAYSASGGVYDFIGTNLETRAVVQRLSGAAYPVAVACSWNGLVVGGSDAYYSAWDVFVFDSATGASLARRSSASFSDTRSLSRLVLSADGTRLVTLSGSGMFGPQVFFQSLPPPP